MIKSTGDRWDQRESPRDTWMKLLTGKPSGTFVIRASSAGGSDVVGTITVVKPGGTGSATSLFNERIVNADGNRVKLANSKHAHVSLAALVVFYQSSKYFATSAKVDVPAALLIPPTIQASVARGGHEVGGSASAAATCEGNYELMWWRKSEEKPTEMDPKEDVACVNCGHVIALAADLVGSGIWGRDGQGFDTSCRIYGNCIGIARSGEILVKPLSSGSYDIDSFLKCGKCCEEIHGCLYVRAHEGEGGSPPPAPNMKKQGQCWISQTSIGSVKTKVKVSTPASAEEDVYGNIYDQVEGGTLIQQKLFERVVERNYGVLSPYNPLDDLALTPLVDLRDAVAALDPFLKGYLVGETRKALTYARGHRHCGTVQRPGSTKVTDSDIAAKKR